MQRTLFWREPKILALVHSLSKRKGGAQDCWYIVVTHHRPHLCLFVMLFFEGSLLNEYIIMCIGYIFVIRFLCQFLSHWPSMLQKKKNSQPPFSSAWIANVFLVSEPPACARKECRARVVRRKPAVTSLDWTTCTCTCTCMHPRVLIHIFWCSCWCSKKDTDTLQEECSRVALELYACQLVCNQLVLE